LTKPPVPKLVTAAQLALAAIATSAIVPPAGATQLDVHEDGTAHYHRLHFSHPMFAESISPDTKLRFSTGGAWETEGREFEFEAEGEYMFHRSFSIEVGVPYVRLDPEGESSASALGNVELTLKGANFAFEDAGVLLGYGLSFGLPTGNPAKGIGSDREWELEPFVNAGYKRGRLELIGWARFGIPVSLPEGAEPENELHYDLAGLFHISSRLQAILEANGEVAINGSEAGSGQISLSPGVKVAPLGPRLFIGVAGSIPLKESELDGRALLSVFYHF